MKLKAARQRVAELKGKIAKALKDRAAIGETAIAEGRAMTTDERTAFVAAKAPIDTMEAELAEAEELLVVLEAANTAERTAAAVPDPDAAAAAAALAASGIRGTTLEVVTRQPIRGTFGRQMQAVRQFAISGGWAHTAEADRLVLRGMQQAAGLQAGPTGLNTDVPSEGGFLVQPTISQSIIQRMYDTGAIASQVFHLPIGAGSNGTKLFAVDETSRADNSRYGGIVSGWLGQGNTLTAGKPKFREMDLKLRKVGAFVYATDELIADSTALEGWIQKYLPLELTFRTEDAIINGDGSNKPAGWLNSGAAVNITRTSAARVLYEDVSNMWKRMWAPLRGGAIWVIDQSVEQELEQIAIAIGTAGVLAPIYKPAGPPVYSPTGTQGYSGATLYGRPVLTTEYCAALGTVGDITLVAPDQYTLIDKEAVETAVSLHVAFLTDEAVWRFLYRVDGQFTWNQALTPKNGGATLSALVTLT